MTQDDDTVQAPAKRRAKPSPTSKPSRKPRAAAVEPDDTADGTSAEGERIAKAMARAGLCSRRDAELWIADGRVSVNGTTLTTPAVVLKPGDRVVVDGKPLPLKERTRLFLYHKPKGLVTTSRDPEGRPTVFERLPDDMPRMISVGRLDINTERLLLLTNDGGLARVLELPSTGWLRRYRVRAFGQVTAEQLAGLKDGVTIDGIAYGPVEATIDTVTGSNVWLVVGLREGKNREVKRIFEHLGLTVNRLIRISFGPFQLADLEEGEVREIRGRVLRDQLGDRLVEQSGADFDAPIVHHLHGEEAPQTKSRQTRDADGGAKPKRRPVRSEKMEFIGTSEDGSREARITRTGKPPVAVTILPSRRDDRPRGRPDGGKPGGKSGGFRDRPDGGTPRGRSAGGPKGAPRGRPEGEGAAPGRRDDRDDRPMRSEGFRGRGRPAAGEAEGGKPQRSRSEGFKSNAGPARPRFGAGAAEGGMKPRPRGPRPEAFGGEDTRGDARPSPRPPRDMDKDRRPPRDMDKAPGAPRAARAEAGDRPTRSEGFRGRSRPAGSDDTGAKPYKPRSEGFRSHGGPAGGPGGGRGKAAGFRDRPESGAAPRDRDADRPREARDDRRSGGFQGDKARPPRSAGPRPERPEGRPPRSGGYGPAKGGAPGRGPTRGGPTRGGPGKSGPAKGGAGPNRGKR
ncbi:MAG: pseudouridine synthase [Ancalomicrobiaceae bacterium]|nr:pseudouridine synthase [Ancalomicrobiaceae bacterium]